MTTETKLDPIVYRGLSRSQLLQEVDLCDDDPCEECEDILLFLKELKSGNEIPKEHQALSSGALAR